MSTILGLDSYYVAASIKISDYRYPSVGKDGAIDGQVSSRLALARAIQETTTRTTSWSISLGSRLSTPKPASATTLKDLANCCLVSQLILCLGSASWGLRFQDERAHWTLNAVITVNLFRSEPDYQPILHRSAQRPRVPPCNTSKGSSTKGLLPRGLLSPVVCGVCVYVCMCVSYCTSCPFQSRWQSLVSLFFSSTPTYALASPLPSLAQSPAPPFPPTHGSRHMHPCSSRWQHVATVESRLHFAS